MPTNCINLILGGFSDVIADALELQVDEITPAKLIELMEENDLGSKTNNIEDIKKWTRWLVSMLQDRSFKNCVVENLNQDEISNLD